MGRRSTNDELAAVRALASRLGLAAAEPVVQKLARHTSVRLGPLVARVQSAGSPEAAWTTMAREVAVAQRLAAEGAPALRPSVDPPPGPYELDGCIVSLWPFVEHRPATEADGAAAGAALKRLHAALAGFEGPLPAYSEAVADCAALSEDEAAMSAARPEDRALLAGLVRAGLERLPGQSAGWVALHGDTHLGNLMVTAAGPIWADFEAVCRGPLEWDLLNRPARFRAPFGRLDAELLERLGALRLACVAVWCWADAERDPEFRAAAEYHTGRLRSEAAASRFA
ncbi:MAG TPA: phosphotransferase [Caulobacteraceae bacterium]|jgi:aminoglycoside phosphotransferase (APT) family kinase protein